MPNIYYETPDALYETIGLMMACINADSIKKDTVQALNNMGINGDAFYTDHMSVFDTYLAEFKNHYQPGGSDTLFFEGIDTGMMLLILSLLVENKEIIKSIDRYEDSEINKEMIDHICSLNDMKPAKTMYSLDGYMDLLGKLSYTDKEKWKLIQILNSPKSRFAELISSVSININAYQKAVDKVSAPLSELKAQYLAAVKQQKSEMFGKLKKSLSKNADVYPSLAFPISQMIFSNGCYYGLLSTYLTSNSVPERDSLLRGLKALSDASRLEILHLINQRPMYNLEIAEQLHLTAATMSHHMGILLACGFVGVTKRDSKVYYHLESDSVKRFIKSLEKSLV